MQTNTYLRTDENYERYRNNISTGCVLCTRKSVTHFKHWQIVENDYAYDAIAEDHDMLTPYRHVAHEDDLTRAEWYEFQDIMRDLDGEDYDAITRNFRNAQTQPSHLHYHLLTYKRR